MGKYQFLLCTPAQCLSCLVPSLPPLSIFSLLALFSLLTYPLPSLFSRPSSYQNQQNHQNDVNSERPLHEIKKKGRPSTQCPHCKELRKAKHVNARCICGREEGSAAVANGLKRAKSLSHDGRLSVPAAIGGEDLLRSVSTQGRSPQDCSDVLSSSGGRHSIILSLASFVPCAAFPS
ncbi:hypothetical protein B0O80DRAFT_291109 [Mortierella sp. GBAus27b]|nr:hypothetical protein B0O80DRAFT_291109 [Mortierella sp. GBAus27b]